MRAAVFTAGLALSALLGDAAALEVKRPAYASSPAARTSFETEIDPESSTSARKRNAHFETGSFAVFDSAGHRLWSAAIPEQASHGLALQPLGSSDWIIAFTCARTELCLRRYTADGKELWRRSHLEERHPKLIRATADGGVLLELAFALSAPLVAKFDGRGERLWRWHSHRHYFVGLEPAPDGSVIVLGNLGRKPKGYWLTRLGSDGSAKWTKKMTPESTNRTFWVTRLSLRRSGDIVVSGHTLSRSSASTLWRRHRFVQIWTLGGRRLE